MSLLFGCSVMSDSVPHELQHARLLCPSPSPGVCSDSCPLSQWCHPAISPSVTPFSSCPQSFPASKFFSWIGSLHMQHIFCMWHWRKLFFLFGSQFSKTVEMFFLILYAILIYWKIFEFLSSFSGHYDSNIYIKILNFGLMGYLF